MIKVEVQSNNDMWVISNIHMIKRARYKSNHMKEDESKVKVV